MRKQDGIEWDQRGRVGVYLCDILHRAIRTAGHIYSRSIGANGGATWHVQCWQRNVVTLPYSSSGMQPFQVVSAMEFPVSRHIPVSCTLLRPVSSAAGRRLDLRTRIAVRLRCSSRGPGMPEQWRGQYGPLFDGKSMRCLAITHATTVSAQRALLPPEAREIIKKVYKIYEFAIWCQREYEGRQQAALSEAGLK